MTDPIMFPAASRVALLALVAHDAKKDELLRRSPDERVLRSGDEEAIGLLRSRLVLATQ